MKFQLFTQVALREDVPEYGLKKGDVGILVEHYAMPEGQEDGYSVEGLIPRDTVELRESLLESVPARIPQVS